MWDVLRGLFGKDGRPPSRRELGPYPLILPLDWILIGPQGEAEPIPHLEGVVVHRILIRGALVATEGGHRAIATKDCVLVQ
jgi:hypothetical protein